MACITREVTVECMMEQSLLKYISETIHIKKVEE